VLCDRGPPTILGLGSPNQGAETRARPIGGDQLTRRSLYSHFIEDKNIRVYVSSLGQIVGATIAGQYNAFGDLDTLRKVLFPDTHSDIH